MEWDLLTWTDLMYVIGEMTVLLILGALLTAFILVIISLYSIKKSDSIFPRAPSGLVFLEGLMKAMFRFFGLEDNKGCYTFLIKLFNSMNTAEISRDPGDRTGDLHAAVPAFIPVARAPDPRRD